ncbi:unnamed protein product [Spirodela intermedia]|uniref:TPX2 central domain-containing protein n=1 Tax=Spirodela intermedia TaxID=51605 RepID=A0A7I8K485_SPIIN|nr:unnamed protein product [Spirodela intermedia]
MAEMDEEMEDAHVRGDDDDGVGAVDFLNLEVDFEYEFEASRYFDFCRPESPSESREAELWFESASSYPPSPFIAKIDLGTDIFGENVDIPSEFNNVVSTYGVTYSDDGSCIELHTTEETEGGTVLEPEASNYFPKVDVKFAIKLPVATRSTLMKPTASHLAKQNDPRDIKTTSRILHRFHKSSTQNSEKSCTDASDRTDQAYKRQKLEGGHSRKIRLVEINVHDLKQQTQLVHKIPQKKEHSDGNPGLRRLKITIPKEPDLGTARRAQRPRSREVELQDASTITMFRARPLNRKILEAPSLPLHQKSTPRLPEFQEFHLKTSERAMQHASASSSFQVRNNMPRSHSQTVATRNRLQPHSSVSLYPHMLHPNDEQRQEECKKELLKFEARSLNKKEFNFKTEKRCHQGLPIDLFNKLSLISEDQQNSMPDLKNSHPTHGSKENIDKVRRQDHEALPTGEIGQKISGRWRLQSERDLVTSSFRSRPYLCSSPSPLTLVSSTVMVIIII